MIDRSVATIQRTVHHKMVQEILSVGLGDTHREIFLIMRSYHEGVGMHSVIRRTGKIYHDDVDAQHILETACDSMVFRRQARTDGLSSRYSKISLLQFHERSMNIMEMQRSEWREWAMGICNPNRSL